MSDEELARVATLAGLQVCWTANDGIERRANPDTLRLALTSLGFDSSRASDSRNATWPRLVTANVEETSSIARPCGHAAFGRISLERGGAIDFRAETGVANAIIVPPICEPGYHRLCLGDRETTLAVAPHKCHSLGDAAGNNYMFGIGVQTYGLRGAASSGFGSGDFGALALFAECAARNGADALAISPAHALFSGDVHHFAPYAPSSRMFLNVMLADPHAVFDQSRIVQAIQSCGLEAEASALDRLDLIDWPRTGAARLKLLRALFDTFTNMELEDSGDARAADYRRFRLEGGKALENHARFEALHDFHFQQDFTRWNFAAWAPPYIDANSSAVDEFAAHHAREIEFHCFAQWLAARSMLQAQQRAIAAGMRIGVINDLAIGLNAGGSHAWSQPDDLLNGLTIGAPPDALAPKGQNWGLRAFSPRALVGRGYSPFIDTLQACLRSVGGLRIDHVMGLARLWLIPDGADAGDGVYVNYPCEDLLRLIALESSRHRAIVIGEDLGTIPNGLREQLAARGLAGLRVLLFERNRDGWFKPQWYPREAIAMTTTHDTATFAGWWSGHDIHVRDRCSQLSPGETIASALAQREAERHEIWRAFSEAGATGDTQPASPASHTNAVDAAIAFQADTTAQLAITQFEDIEGSIEQPNLPGTIDEHPNWRRRYSAPAKNSFDDESCGARVARLAQRKMRRL